MRRPPQPLQVVTIKHSSTSPKESNSMAEGISTTSSSGITSLQLTMAVVLPQPKVQSCMMPSVKTSDQSMTLSRTSAPTLLVSKDLVGDGSLTTRTARSLSSEQLPIKIDSSIRALILSHFSPSTSGSTPTILTTETFDQTS